MHIICTSSSLTFTMPTRLMFYSAKIAIVLAKFPISLYLVWRPHIFRWNKYDYILDIWSFYPPFTWKYNDEMFKQRRVKLCGLYQSEGTNSHLWKHALWCIFLIYHFNWFANIKSWFNYASQWIEVSIDRNFFQSKA